MHFTYRLTHLVCLVHWLEHTSLTSIFSISAMVVVPKSVCKTYGVAAHCFCESQWEFSASNKSESISSSRSSNSLWRHVWLSLEGWRYFGGFILTRKLGLKRCSCFITSSSVQKENELATADKCHYCAEISCTSTSRSSHHVKLCLNKSYFHTEQCKLPFLLSPAQFFIEKKCTGDSRKGSLLF